MKIKSYISDPKWNNRFLGRFIYIYRGSGVLEWGQNLLIYSDKKRKLQIEKNKIIEIKLGRYHRTAKPITLNFIDIKYRDDGPEEKRLFFTPTLPNKNPWLSPVWKTNEYVRGCLNDIKEWRLSGESRNE